MKIIYFALFSFVFAFPVLAQDVDNPLKQKQFRLQQERVKQHSQMSKERIIHKQFENSSKNGKQELSQSQKPMLNISGSGVDTAWVRHYASGLTPSNDYASAMVIDGSDNVYVTGYSAGSGTSNDYVTVKYNSSGVEQWVSRYNEPVNYEDWTSALAVDGSGNVYSSTGHATIKYNSSGVEQWVSRYNRPGSSFDFTSAIAVDGSGNVFVTGYSYGSGTGLDYATVKYNSSGVEQWVSRYNGPANSSDWANAIAIDGTGNVYVTGSSIDSVTSDDYATVKYNSSGVEQWVNRYNGPANFSDEANAIAVDDTGNVYVTGSSSFDYATVKYNSSGSLQWVNRYNGPANYDDYATALAVDGAGNVYVTGYSYGSVYDYATVKYNNSGVEQWVNRYKGPGSSFDWARAIAVDGSGNVYVTGYSYGSGTSYDYTTVKYNSSGVEQWVSRYNGPANSSDWANAIAIDGTGNVYVTGSSIDSVTSDDYATVKYNSSGVEQWVNRYNGPWNSSGEANAIAVDGSGNLYVTGTSYGSRTSYDYATVKYNSSGVEQWVSLYNGPGNYGDRANALAVDGTGNVYVTGISGYDYATVKYNSSGVEQWVSRYNGPRYSDDYANALAVDDSGNVYVTGYSYGSGTSSDYATVKYNSSGVEQWVSRYNGPGSSSDWASALAVDGSGNVYVTGNSEGSGTGLDYATVKYNSSGVEQWVSRYNGPGNYGDRANALAVDGSGNVYVTGYSTGSGTSNDYATVKYNSSGVEQWVRRYNGPGNSYDGARALAVDGSGNVYVTGSSSSDYATVKYNNSGVEQWVSRYNGPEGIEDYATALAVDGSGNVYVAGSSAGSESSNDYATVKYNSSGVEQWVSRYNGPGNSSDRATALAIDGSGKVYVTGSSDGQGGSVYTTVKYVQTPTSVRDIGTGVPEEFSLEQNYPNPFNPSTTIRYSLPSSAKVRLTVYNLLGQAVSELVNGEQSAGWKEVQWNARQTYGGQAANVSSGIYFYKLQAGEFAQVKKMQLLK